MDALSQPEQLAQRAEELGYPAISVTDHGNVHNFIRVYQECKKRKIKFIPGCEFYFTNDHDDREQKSYHLTILAKNNKGLSNIYKMITWANVPVDKGGGMYYKPRISWVELERYSEGIICLTGCMNSPMNRKFLDEGYAAGKHVAKKLKKIFGSDLYVELQYVEEIREHAKLLKLCRRVSKELSISAVATNDCHYIKYEDKEIHDVLKSVNKGGLKYSGDDYYLKSAEEMLATFTPEEVAESVKIAEQCDVVIPLKKSHMPTFDSSISKEAAYNKLVREVKKGWKFWGINDYENVSEYRKRLKVELKDIKEADLTNYFLIVWDTVSFADRNNIGRNFSRGSAGGSLVAFCLRIGLLDPIKYGLLWSRFWNRGRKDSMPDIDLDIDSLRRGEVIEYLRNKFGKDKVFPMMTISKMKARVAVTDVARAVGLPFHYVKELTKKIDKKAKTIKEAIAKNALLDEISKGQDDDVKTWGQEVVDLEEELKSIRRNTGKRDFKVEGKIIDLQVRMAERSKKLIKTFKVAERLEKTARQRSKHACALLISDKQVFGRVPLVWDNKHKSLMTGFDMYDVEKMGYLKLDVLGVAAVTLLSKIMPNGAYDILKKGFEDEKAYDIIKEGDCKGIFQFEQGLGVRWCKKMKPGSVEEVAAVSALLRPGPLETGLSDQYCENKRTGNWTYIHEDLKPICGPTYGVMVFQEQMIKIVQKFGGFDEAHADKVRKACGKKLPEEMEKHKDDFIKGCLKNGYDADVADELWRWVEAQAGYSFNKSHAVGYGMLTYATAYLKARHTIKFFNALLQLSQFGKQKQRINISEIFYNAKLFEIDVKRPSFKVCNEDFEIKRGAIVYGLGHIKNIGKSAVAQVRKLKGLKTWGEVLLRKKGVKKPTLKALIYSGAMDHFGASRLQLDTSFEFMESFTDREKPILEGLLLTGEPVRLGKKVVDLGKAKSVRDAVIKLSEFLEEENVELKAINSNRADKLLDACHGFLAQDENEELTTKAKAGYEIFYLGIPATCSEVDVYNNDDKTHSCREIRDKLKSGRTAKTIGIIMDVSRKIDRHGNDMAFIKVADSTYMIECCVFHKVLDRCDDKIELGRAVMVEGKKSRGSLIADRITAL
jgi:DNA polymerase-3 subunit alpha